MKSLNGESSLSPTRSHPFPAVGTAPGVITVAIAEGDPVIRASLRQLLERAPEVRCVQVCVHAAEALHTLPVIAPHVALVDLELPGFNGVELVARLRALAPSTGILVMTTFEDGNLIFNMLRAGAGGCLLKTTPQPELVQAISMVHTGGSLVSVQMARKIAVHFQPPGNGGVRKTELTLQEESILALLAKGHPYPAIGSQLGLNPEAVGVQMRSVCDKLKP